MRNHQNIRTQNSLLLSGSSGAFLAVLFFFSTSIFGQHSKVIYSGLENASSIYATQDHLFVVESGKHRILKLDHTGKLLETVGGIGTGNYQFDTPIDIDATNGMKIYVSDYRNNRILLYDRRFQHLSTIKGEATFERRTIRPTQLVVNNFGELFYADEASNSILKHDENGNLEGRFPIPTAFNVDEMRFYQDQIELIDQGRSEVLLMRQNGLFGERFPFPKSKNEGLVQIQLNEKKIILFGDRIEIVE